MSVTKNLHAQYILIHHYFFKMFKHSSKIILPLSFKILNYNVRYKKYPYTIHINTSLFLQDVQTFIHVIHVLIHITLMPLFINAQFKRSHSVIITM